MVCCSPWGHEELDTTGQLNNNNNYGFIFTLRIVEIFSWRIITRGARFD